MDILEAKVLKSMQQIQRYHLFFNTQVLFHVKTWQLLRLQNNYGQYVKTFLRQPGGAHHTSTGETEVAELQVPIKTGRQFNSSTAGIFELLVFLIVRSRKNGFPLYRRRYSAHPHSV